MKNKKRQSSSRPLLAFLLIVIGVGYLLKNLEIIPEFTIFFDGFWTLFIIIPAIINIISGKSRRAGFIWLFIGLALLSLCIDALRVVRPLLIPVFLILIGFMLFTKKGTFKYRRIYNKLSEDYARYPVYRAFFPAGVFPLTISHISERSPRPFVRKCHFPFPRLIFHIRLFLI